MDLTIKINLDNDAFEQGRDDELGRIFQKIRSALIGEDYNTCIQGFAVDSNGNKCGTWKLR